MGSIGGVMANDLDLIEVAFKLLDHEFNLRRHKMGVHLRAVVFGVAPENAGDGRLAVEVVVDMIGKVATRNEPRIRQWQEAQTRRQPGEPSGRC